MLTRVMGRPARLLDPLQRRTSRSWCCVTSSPYCGEATPGCLGSIAPSSARWAGCSLRRCASCGWS